MAVEQLPSQPEQRAVVDRFRRADSATRAGRLLISRRRFTQMSVGVLGAAAATAAIGPFATAAASPVQAGGVPASVHAKDDVSQYGIEAQWVPPPTGPRTQEELSAASPPPTIEEQIKNILSGFEAGTRRPPTVSSETPPLSAEEVQAISTDMKDIADAVRTWMRPEMLKKYPDLNFTQLADDPQQLKAYIEAGYLRKDNLYFNDIRTEQDEVVSFMPEGPKGSRFITIYKRPDGTVYKVRIGIHSIMGVG